MKSCLCGSCVRSPKVIQEVESHFVNGSVMNAHNTERTESSPLISVQSDRSIIESMSADSEAGVMPTSASQVRYHTNKLLKKK